MLDSPETGAASGYEPPVVGAGTQDSGLRTLQPHDDQSCDFDLIWVLSGIVYLYEGHSPGQGKRFLSHARSKHELCFYKAGVGVMA